jgi:hypothetical protein
VWLAKRTAVLIALGACAFGAMNEAACAQPSRRSPVVRTGSTSGGTIATAFDSTGFALDPPPSDSQSEAKGARRARLAAARDRRLRIVISLDDRRLWALIGDDTLLDAPVAVSSDARLSYAGRSWQFETPRGVRTVQAKRENPVWIPPDWHYAEVARDHALELSPLKPGGTKLRDGQRLEVRDDTVGIVDAASGEYQTLPVDEEIVFDGTLFIPPVGSVNRRIDGELGLHALDTGGGILLHGTPHKGSIGNAVTHGCVRLRDQDIAWLYEMVPVGAPVYIY